jgi:hypothetical protein
MSAVPRKRKSPRMAPLSRRDSGKAKGSAEANDEAEGHELDADHSLLHGARSRRIDQAVIQKDGETFGDHRRNVDGRGHHGLLTMTPMGSCDPSIAAKFSGTIRPASSFTDTVTAKPSPAAKAMAPAVMVKPIWLANAVPVVPSPTRLPEGS